MTARELPPGCARHATTPSVVFPMPDVEVRAILEGRKTQARAPVARPFVHGDIHGDKDPMEGLLEPPAGNPFGVPGNQFRVAEAFQIRTLDTESITGLATRHFAQVGYRSDESSARFEVDSLTYHQLQASRVRGWSPAARMPSWATRLFLEVLRIRTQRFQDISEVDAIAEGVRYFPDLPVNPLRESQNKWSMTLPESINDCLSSATFAFANYFCKKQNGGHPDFRLWDTNPWLWVAEFRATHVAALYVSGDLRNEN
jgi:hypothetical protein